MASIFPPFCYLPPPSPPSQSSPPPTPSSSSHHTTREEDSNTPMYSVVFPPIVKRDKLTNVHVKPALLAFVHFKWDS
ncbi:hypothetical protein M0804_002183 [Polistes exclamans]|nr:hypothetical protein M0804_002183 [Polistes exclamans]